MIEDDFSWRRSNIGYLLDAASNRFLREKLDFVRRGGLTTISEPQLSLILHVGEDGIRPSVLAARLGLGKSTISELAGRAASAGLVSRKPDPLDSRASFVLLTPAGNAALACAQDAIAEGEQALLATLGERDFAILTTSLSKWLDHSSLAPTEKPIAGSEQPRPNLGRLLVLSERAFVGRVLYQVREAGFEVVGEPLLTLFRHLEFGGSRLTRLADQARMTKQSMREIVARAIGFGLIEQNDDPEDARARRIRFSPTGLSLLAAIGRAVESAEAEWCRTIGGHGPTVKYSLRTYIDSGPVVTPAAPSRLKALA